MRAFTRAAALAAAVLMLTACATARETAPARTATEELLVSHASEARCYQTASRSACRHPRLRRRVRRERGGERLLGGPPCAPSSPAAARGLVDRASADVVIELRCAALSIDQVDRVFGLPAMTIPTSRTLQTTTTTPELSLFSTHRREGVARDLGPGAGRAHRRADRLGGPGLRHHHADGAPPAQRLRLRPARAAPSAPARRPLTHSPA